jgi:hypothetical protein
LIEGREGDVIFMTTDDDIPLGVILPCGVTVAVIVNAVVAKYVPALIVSVPVTPFVPLAAMDTPAVVGDTDHVTAARGSGVVKVIVALDDVTLTFWDVPVLGVITGAWGVLILTTRVPYTVPYVALVALIVKLDVAKYVPFVIVSTPEEELIDTPDRGVPDPTPRK